MNELFKLTATELVNGIKKKDYSCLEVAQAFVDRIDLVNPTINALHQVDSEKILTQARIADDHPSDKPLHGLPITIKDAYKVAGFITGKACPALMKDYGVNATCVQRLLDAGAIILGISNVPEFLFATQTDNDVYGRTNNPHDLTRSAGGSSGGEAAAVASGMSPVGLACDAGGSTRMPANNCGVCGHKPTRGLIPQTGLVPLDGAGFAAQSLAYGPIARSAEDLELFLSVLAGADNLDPHSPPVSLSSSNEVDISTLRIAHYSDNGIIQADTDTQIVFENVIKFLSSKVASIKSTKPRGVDQTYKLHLETYALGGDKGKQLENMIEMTTQGKYSKLVQQFIDLTKTVEFDVTTLRQRVVEIEKFRFNTMAFMQDYDIIITPAMPTVARKHGDGFKHIKDMTFLTTFNLLGFPATVIPCGKSSEGLPIGIQIAARNWNDHLCLAIGKLLQGEFGTPEVVTPNV